jgi:hypothetical protein
LISAAVEESRLSMNALNAGFVWTHPRFAFVGARFCCRRISTVNEGRTRFKESPQYCGRLPGSAEVFENPRFFGTHVLSALANGLGGLMDKENFPAARGGGDGAFR